MKKKHLYHSLSTSNKEFKENSYSAYLCKPEPTYSEGTDFLCEVPQGSVLEPLLLWHSRTSIRAYYTIQLHQLS